LIPSSISNTTRVEIELTSTCNLKCPLCIRQTDPSSIIDMKYRPLKEWIQQLDTYKNLEYVTIAGPTSEPTLYPDLIKLIQYLIKRDIEISLFINGDTYNEKYYRRLGVIFSQAKGHIYFTVCGSTQELHSKYRVGSTLSKVLKHLDIIHTYSKKAIVTWIIFNYNEDDFNENKDMFAKYETEYFYTLPVDEHFGLGGDIHLPNNLHKIYDEVDKNDFSDIKCPAMSYKFNLISANGDVNPCGLHRMYGDDHCFECSVKNSELLRKNKIYKLAEAESEYSEIALRVD